MKKDKKPCHRGCGTPTGGTWAPGHDSLALKATIAKFYGDVAGFVDAHRDR